MSNCYAIASSLLLFASRTADARCLITDLSPTGTLSNAPEGQTFEFVATDNCTLPAFEAPLTSLRKQPVRGDAVGTDRHRYTVHLTRSELDDAIRVNDNWFVWIAIGWDGRRERVQMLNDLDFDHDGWTRSAGDYGACDLHANRNPGVTDVAGNGIDEDCDGQVDNVRYAIPDAIIGAAGDQITVGDVDGDGITDLEIASHSANRERGAVYVVYGPTDGNYDVADAVELTTTREHVGWSVDAGDADADGIADVLTGDLVGEGAYLFLGPITADRVTYEAAALFQGPTGNSSALDVDLVPDFDGDGLGDVVVSAPNTGPNLTGAVYVASGVATGTVSLESSATYAFIGPSEYSYFGRFDFEIGDATGDGIEDLAFATPYANLFYGSAAVYLVEGGAPSATYDVASAAWATLTGERTLSYLGMGVANGDYDGDGAQDLIVGDPQALTAGGAYSGKVYGFIGPFSGVTSASDAPVSWEGTESWAGIGSDVAASDVDGDNQLDVLIGAGAVYLQRGATTASSTSPRCRSSRPPGAS